jgi:hypothetical protein
MRLFRRSYSHHCKLFLGTSISVLLTVLILVSVAMAQNAPASPISRQDRFGVYFWDPDYEGFPSSLTSRLAWGSDLVADTGTRTIRVFIGDPTYACASGTLGPYKIGSYPSGDPTDYLAQIAQSPEYTALFNDSRFSTYLLTTYTVGATADPPHWVDGLTDAEFEYERIRVYKLCAYLVTFNKNFTLLNWEGDHRFTFNPTSVSRDGFVRWIKAMAKGVEDARANFSSIYPGRVYSGLEFVCTGNFGHPSCGSSGTPLVLNYVAPRVKVDYLSYSSWNSLGVGVSNLTPTIQDNVDTIISTANTRSIPDGVAYDRRNVILGEYGWAGGGASAANLVKEMFNAAETAGVAYAIYWQILNNLGTDQDRCAKALQIPNFGLFTPSSSSTVELTTSGQEFSNSILADTVWVDDSVPTGATLDAQGGDSWNFLSTNPSPISGALVHQSNISAGQHQHYFYNSPATLSVSAGDSLYAFVFLDPNNPPTEVMLQWNDGTWLHRAYWGENNLTNESEWGIDGTDSRRYIGPLPPTGKWVRLKVPASQVGLEGRVLNGMAFTLFGGRATWDRAGKLTAAPDCSNSQLYPSSQDFITAGGTGTVNVGASKNCNWVAVSNDSWITITAGASGISNGTVAYTVSANTAATLRKGTMTIAGKTFTVTQAGTGLQFYPLAHPVRLLDTRTGQTGCDTPGAPIPGGTSRTQIARNRTCDGIFIPNTAAVITGNITTVLPPAGYLTLYPSNSAQPLVANSNYASNEVLNNVFTVGLGDDGAFKIFVTSNTEVVVDVTGYYAPPGTGGLYFHRLPAPVRLLETRAGFSGCLTPGTPLPGNTDTSQTATGACTGIPASARAIVGNATTVNPQGTGFPFLTLFPADAAAPLAASSNYLPGQVMNAPFTVGLSSTGAFKIRPTTQTDLIVDVLGYYSTDVTDVNGTGLLFNPLPSPVRLLETRAGFAGCYGPGAPLPSDSIRTQPAQGSCNGVIVPSTALGIVGNATVVNTSGGFLTFWPSNAAQPTTATSNFSAGQVLNRHFTVGLGTDGAFKIFTQFTSDLIVDISGYFAP